MHFGFHPGYFIAMLVVGLLIYLAVRGTLRFVRGMLRELARPD